MSITRRTALLGLSGLALAAPAVHAQTPDRMTYLYPAPGNLPAFAPFALARQRGYYQAENLEITWQVGRGGVDVATQLAAGNAQLGGGIGDTSIIVRAQDAPVRGVALLGGRTLTQVYARRDANIRTLADLRGKRIGVLAFQDTTFFNLLGVLRSQNLRREDANIQAVGAAGMIQLMIAGTLDAICGVPEWAAGIEAANVPLDMFNIDAVFPAMAQAIMASDQTIARRPETIRRFVRATLRGIEDIKADPAAMSRLYTQAVPEHAGREAGIENIMRRYVQLVYTTDAGATLGRFDEARMSRVQAFYVENQIVQRAVPIRDTFTNDFVAARS
jgi:NitT/TauT family transport system substrate-binding protein